MRERRGRVAARDTVAVGRLPVPAPGTPGRATAVAAAVALSIACDAGSRARGKVEVFELGRRVAAGDALGAALDRPAAGAHRRPVTVAYGVAVQRRCLALIVAGRAGRAVRVRLSGTARHASVPRREVPAAGAALVSRAVTTPGAVLRARKAPAPIHPLVRWIALGDAAVSAAPADAAGIAARDAEGAKEAVGRAGTGAPVSTLGAAPAAPTLGVGELQCRALRCAAGLGPVACAPEAARRPCREAPVAGRIARDTVRALGVRAVRADRDAAAGHRVSVPGAPAALRRQRPGASQDGIALA